MKGNKNVCTRDNKHSVDCTGSCETCESLRIVVDLDIGLLRMPMCVNLQVVGTICFKAPQTSDHQIIKKAFISGKTTGYPVTTASWFCRGMWFKERKIPHGNYIPTHSIDRELIIRENGNHTIPTLRMREE